MSYEVLDSYNLETLKPQMERLGYQFRYIPQTSTTMRLAEAHALSDGILPAVFLTDHQTKGIGREGRVWLDRREASILVSGVLLIKDNTIPVLSDMVALHVCRVLESITNTPGFMLKYPNDFVANGEKLGGMLSVNHYDGGHIYKGTTLGIGLNIHYSTSELKSYPTDYGTTALDLHTPEMNSRQAILVAIFGGMQFLPVDAEVFTTNNQVRQDQNNLWKKFSFVLQRDVKVESEDDLVIEGRVVDTQIGEGILVENASGRRWFNQFDSKMKIRLLN